MDFGEIAADARANLDIVDGGELPGVFVPFDDIPLKRVADGDQRRRRCGLRDRLDGSEMSIGTERDRADDEPQDQPRSTGHRMIFKHEPASPRHSELRLRGIFRMTAPRGNIYQSPPPGRSRATMTEISGKRAFLALLKQEGVDLMFGNPGTTELPLMDALAVESGLRYVLGLQEAAVLAMADGYAQASGKLAVANLHVAPGLGNAMGMLYDAQKAGAPLLVTAGQHDQSFNFTEPILWADLPPLARPLVKWSAEVRRLEDLPRAVHRAAKTALAPPTGPVFLSLPADVLNAEGEVDLGHPTRVAPRLRGDRAAVEAAADLLARAERPLIMAGDAVAQGDAHRELVAVAELLGAPVYAEAVANTASFPASHPLFRGSFVRQAPAIRQLLSGCDLLFSVGADLLTLS